ncbi:hypothetical protein LEP1GSC170_6044 [Leptospira interrogans serovar Bataviae str. HAI135]|nr:hypothetical protein LEP1GSC170_6044 [Leptospira interrogans serovar Bataviae str. HAI135]
MYDTDNYYGATGGYVNRNTKDGLIVDPSKVNGPLNRFVLDQIASSPLIPDAGDGSLKTEWFENRIYCRKYRHIYFGLASVFPTVFKIHKERRKFMSIPIYEYP